VGRRLDGKKIYIAARIDRGLHEWIRKRTGPGKQFHNLTHAIERGIARLKADAEGEGDQGTD
jgi:hypothetical protein